MILTKEDFNNIVKTLVGERTDDEALEIVQNLTDTYADMEAKSANAISYEQKLKDLDEEWRKKYRDTFYNNNPDVDTGDSVDTDGDVKEYKYENLFKEGE